MKEGVEEGQSANEVLDVVDVGLEQLVGALFEEVGAEGLAEGEGGRGGGVSQGGWQEGGEEELVEGEGGEWQVGGGAGRVQKVHQRRSIGLFCNSQ